MPASEQILKRTIHFDNDPVGPFYDATLSKMGWDVKSTQKGISSKGLLILSAVRNQSYSIQALASKRRNVSSATLYFQIHISYLKAK